MSNDEKHHCEKWGINNSQATKKHMHPGDGNQGSSSVTPYGTMEIDGKRKLRHSFVESFCSTMNYGVCGISQLHMCNS